MNDPKWLNDRMDKQDSKLEEITQQISEITVTMAVNTESLKQHMKRSDLLEAQVNNLPQKVLIFISIIGGIITILSKVLS